MPDEIGDYNYETDSDLDEDEIREDSRLPMPDGSSTISASSDPNHRPDQLKVGSTVHHQP